MKVHGLKIIYEGHESRIIYDHGKVGLHGLRTIYEYCKQIHVLCISKLLIVHPDFHNTSIFSWPSVAHYVCDI